MSKLPFAVQFVIGVVVILPVAIVGGVCHRLGDAADYASDWLEGKVFGDD